MSKQPLKPEDYELLKDSLDQAEFSEFSKDNEYSLLETRLAKYQSKATTFDYAEKTIQTNNDHQSRVIMIMRMVAVFLIALGLISLLSTYLFNDTKRKSKSDNKIENYLNTEFSVKDQQHDKKVYAFYFSSLHCKPCKDFITELDQLNNQMKKSNKDFEIIFIELKHNPKHSNINSNFSFAKLNYKSLKNKSFFDKYKSKQYGPSFVILNNQGKVLAQHSKGLSKQSFSKVLNQFTTILNKG